MRLTGRGVRTCPMMEKKKARQVGVVSKREQDDLIFYDSGSGFQGKRGTTSELVV